MHDDAQQSSAHHQTKRKVRSTRAHEHEARNTQNTKAAAPSTLVHEARALEVVLQNDFLARVENCADVASVGRAREVVIHLNSGWWGQTTKKMERAKNGIN